MRRFGLLLLLPLAVGCDVAVVAVAAAGGSSGSSSSAAAAPSAPTVTVAATTSAALEAGLVPGVFTFTRAGDTTASLDVVFTVSGTATAATDYTIGASPVTIAAGSSTATVAVTPVDDALVEDPPETVIVTISAGSTYFVGTPASATVNLTSDDDDRYHVWVANLTAGDATAQEAALLANGGNPSTSVWTEVGTGTASAEFDPVAAAASINTVLIQVSDAQVYEIDSVEVRDGNGTIVETPNGTVYSARISGATAANYLGIPDGVTATTAATAGNKSVIFTRFASPINSLRVNIWRPNSRISGDVQWSRTVALAGDQVAGGAAVSSAGVIYYSFHDDPSLDTKIGRYDASGTPLATVIMATGITAPAGSHTVAVDDANSAVYVAATVAAGDIAVEKYSVVMVDTTPVPGTFFFTTSFVGNERIESNGMAVDSLGNIILAGGVAVVGQGIDHWITKVSSVGAQPWIGPPAQPADGVDTWWRGVAVDGGDHIFAAGDLTVGGVTDVLTGRVTSAGAADWSNTLTNAGLVDLGHAVDIDRFNNVGDVIVGGYQTVAGQGKNGVLHRYTNGGITIAPFPLTHNSATSTDDEILDVVVDPTNGAIYAVGYESINGHGTNMWIRRYTSAGAIEWTRTHHHSGFGNSGDDRAVSVMISGNFLIVVGDVTLAGGGKEIHVRKYVK